MKMLPNSNLVVLAKRGETKILFKNYIQLGQGEYTLNTVLRSIAGLVAPPEHKILMVFDKNLDAFFQYSLFNISEMPLDTLDAHLLQQTKALIGCPDDENILLCSPIYTYQDVFCKGNYQWSLVNKKCICKAGFYKSIATGKCEKCECPHKYQQCFQVATNCND